MLSRTGSVFLICTGLLFSSSLRAESNLKAASATINLRDAITRTFEHNPTLRAFSYQLRAQGGRESQAGMAASPEVNFVVEDALGTGVFDGIDNAQATLSIGWVLEGKVRKGFTDVARAGTSSLTAESNIKRLDAAAETARLYLICLANQARLINAAKTVELAEETVKAIRKRVAAGKTPEAELARARADVAHSLLDHEDIEHELSSAIRLLAAQWGDIDPGFTHVEGSISVLPVITSFEVLKRQLEQSPEFTRLLADKRLKQAELNLAEAQSSSNWHVNLGVRHFETTNDQALVAGISIPFGERSRNTGHITEARENLSQTAVKEDELRVRYETSLYVLYEELLHSLHRIDAHRNEIIPLLENALEETRRAYELGRYSYFEWRSVQSDLLEARSALVEDSIDAHLKVIEIERLTGLSMTQPAMTQPISK